MSPMYAVSPSPKVGLLFPVTRGSKVLGY